MNENIYVLKEIHKGAKMGMDSISFVAEKVGDENFKDNLMYQYHLYCNIVDDVNNLYQDYGEIPDDNSLKDTVMAWTGIQMNTITNKSNSHLADMLIQGTTMGIIEGRKLLNQHPNTDPQIRNTLDSFVKMQENNVEKLKTFL